MLFNPIENNFGLGDSIPELLCVFFLLKQHVKLSKNDFPIKMSFKLPMISATSMLLKEQARF